MESKKFKDLKVGDVIYFCNCRGKFSKETILNGYVLKVKTFNVDRIEKFTNLIKISDNHLGISLNLKKNVMKCYTNYFIYSTSKEYIEKEIKYNFNNYIIALKEKIKYGKRAEKELNELLNSNIILNNFKNYTIALKENIKYGNRAEKELNNLLNSNIIL